MQHNHEEAAKARKEIFKFIFPNEDISLIDPIFFYQNYDQFSDFQLVRYQIYYRKLKELEKEKKEYEQEQRKEQRKEYLELKLSQFYPTNILHLIMISLPDRLFTDENFVIAKERLFFIIHEIFRNYSDEKINYECDVIYSCLSGTESGQEINSDVYTPSFSDEGNLITIENPSSEFYPSKFIFKRKCYEKLISPISKASITKPVAVIGDPGIGKSTFIGYIFSRLTKKCEDSEVKIKTFWEMESGDWRYFDGFNTQFGSGDSDLWKSNDVLLLIDGKFKDKHLRKKNNIILFCSPQPQNYAKLIKAHSGAIFVMPCWDLDEIIEYISDGNVISDLMGEFYTKISESLDKDELAAFKLSENEGRLKDFERLETFEIGKF